MYYQAITAVEAQESLLKMTLADYQSNMKKDSRKKVHRKIHKMAYPLLDEKNLSSDQVAKILREKLSGR